MRHVVLAIILFLLPLNADAHEITVESKITAAKIFNDRATLTRTTRVKIPEGKHIIAIRGLPANMYTDSLRAEGQSTANVVLGAIAHKQVSSTDFIVPKEKELNTQLVFLQDQNKIHNAEKAALNVSKQFLENIGKQAALRENEEIAKLDFEPERWASVADNLTSKVAANLKAAISLDIKIRETNEKIKKVRNELNQLRTGQKQSYVVTIPYEADKETELDLELSYQVPNVGWRPLYDARLDTQSGELKLIQYASVYQRTGEDWSDIELTLSTARPSQGTGLPPLHTKWLSLYNNRQEKITSDQALSLGRATFSAAPALQESAVVGLDSRSRQKTQLRAAQIDTTGFVGEYKITGLASVKADGTQEKLLIGTFETDNKLEVQIKPQLSSEAFLVAKTTLKSEAPILPGRVNLFRDGAYIGQTYVDMLRQGDEQTLSFGIDNNVTVTRNTIKDQKSEAGLITKDNVVERNFITEIQNPHKKPINITVLETVPASQNEKIRVELVKSATTAGYQQDAENVKGVTRWSKQLKPSEKTLIKLGWKVSWPKGENISGL